MKKLLLLLTLPLLAVCFNSCGDESDDWYDEYEHSHSGNRYDYDDDDDYQPAPTTFEMDINNTTNDPYDLEINGEYQGIILANKGYSFVLEAGYYKFELTQRSGYLFYPTVLEWSDKYGVGDDHFFTIK